MSDDRNDLEDLDDDALSMAQLESLNQMLRNPALWAEPSADVEERVVAAITAEAADGRPVGPTDRAPQAPIDLVDHRRRQRSVNESPEPTERAQGRRWGRLVMAAAAALVVVAAAAIATTGLRSSDGSNATTFALAPSDFAPEASAVAVVEERANGARILMSFSGLPPAPPGTFYEVWLVRPDPKTAISAGTFHMRGAGNGEIEFWAGVGTDRYSTMTVRLEQEADPAATGQLVFEGSVPSVEP